MAVESRRFLVRASDLPFLYLKPKTRLAFMIFDAHVHVGDFPAFGVSLDGDGLKKLMKESSIDQCIVMCPDNAYVRDVVRETAGAHALVWANPREPGNIDAAIKWLDDPNFVGIKLHPTRDGFLPNDPGLHPLVELAAKRDLPILVHSGHPHFSLPWSIEELAIAFPEAKVIMGHMGHGNIVYINAAIAAAERNGNVYLETSGMPMSIKIAEAVERVGVDRVMYGSDAPFHHPDVEILKVQRSGMPAALIDHVLGESARVLFKL
jgi:predicted TIM-barrel fold metal-dependent hydrolase